MDAFITVLSLVVALSFMVLVHEFGHLVAAKRAGVVVEEFGMGYPPRVVALRRSNGRIVVDGRPIIVPRGLELPKGLAVGSRVVFETTADAKGRAVLVRIAEAGPVGAGPGEESASAGNVELLDRGTIYSINAVLFGGFTKMSGEEDPTYPGSLASKGKLVRIGVLAAGAGMNLLTAALFFALAYGLGAPAIADPANAVINTVAANSPAEEAGILPGDVVLKADGTDILDVEGLQQYIQTHLDQAIRLTVERDGGTMEIVVVPRANPPQGELPVGISMSPRTTIERHPWSQAVWLGLKETVTLSGFILTVPVKIVRGLIPADLARPVGPVGVGQLVGDAVKYTFETGWWFPVMQMMGSLSVALAVTNLLPLPALDGGRILFIVVEAIRGRRVDPAKEGLVHLVGMALLVALMLFITWQDVVNPLPRFDWSGLF